jgi:hypothetical protein
MATGEVGNSVMQIQRPYADLLILKDDLGCVWYARLFGVVFTSLSVMFTIAFLSVGIPYVIIGLVFMAAGIWTLRTAFSSTSFDTANGIVTIKRHRLWGVKTEIYPLSDIEEFSLVEVSDPEGGGGYKPVMLLSDSSQVYLSEVYYAKYHVQDLLDEIRSFLQGYRYRKELGRFH